MLYQDKTKSSPRTKPKISESGVDPKLLEKQKKLPCQQVQPYPKPTERPSLPNDMKLHPENVQLDILDMKTARETAAKREFLITLLRVGLNRNTEETPIWSAVHTLVSSSTVPLMRVGFLPVIPEPITNYASVRQLCYNFENIREQLGQPEFAMWYDQPVYDMAREVILNEQGKLKKIVPCMGPFHDERVLMKCGGKHLRGSGVDTALVECEVFGPGVLETVLTGSHYYRSLVGIEVLEDIVMSCVYISFWKTKDKNRYTCLPALEEVNELLSKNKPCSEKFEALSESDSVALVRKDNETFIKECRGKSEVMSDS